MFGVEEGMKAGMCLGTGSGWMKGGRRRGLDEGWEEEREIGRAHV